MALLLGFIGVYSGVALSLSYMRREKGNVSLQVVAVVYWNRPGRGLFRAAGFCRLGTRR